MNILAVDPGSTSTKIGIYFNGKIYKHKVEHLDENFLKIKTVVEQKDIRFDNIKQFLKDNNFEDVNFDAIVARGGLIKSVEGGVYEVNERLIEDLKKGVNGEHPANLGGILAREFAEIYNCPAFIVDPPIIDEMWEIAKITGVNSITRKSKFHALNHKEVARRVAKEKLSKRYEDSILIVAHMGGGITIGLHYYGKVVDVNNGLDGDGPFAVERAGSLPVDGIIEYLKNTEMSLDKFLKLVVKESGIYSHLKTKDMIKVEDMVTGGDNEAEKVLDAFVYNISKEIGGLFAAAKGKIDGIVLTGGLANSKLIVEKIRDYVGFMSEIYVVPGEYEIEALINGAIRVLKGEENAKIYE
ncbi:butyrate kinase [Deferribacter autotrophicus]|uniref:Probable butyrate kinase n=1 Tax=Deferribacter autotrophicus TaxID=500465 RepID=A0A5A8F6N8_9BACT|nr:butyrate kinase [Deferribacter autotrophicus]KAA0257394.1 butyrate kinase [Deferribacter autotrophicus]